MNKIVVRVNLRKNSEVFNSEFSVFEYSAKWKTRSWKTSEFDQCASEKTPRSSTPGFRYTAKWKTPSGKTDSLKFPSRLRSFDSDTCCELAKPKEGRLSKCLIHASRESGKEKHEKFFIMGATRCATKFKIDIYKHEVERILTPNLEQS